jgi:hypothetical protein
MLIAKVENNQIIKIADYREMFPNISFPRTISAEFMSSNNLLGVTIWKPHTSLQKLVSCNPYIENGQVFTVRVERKTDAEIKADTDSLAAKVRADRNQRLSACDWTQIADSKANKEAWGVYRQALRDITSQPKFPSEVTWPQEPK